MLLLWDVENGFSAIDKYSLSTQSWIKAGAALANGTSAALRSLVFRSVRLCLLVPRLSLPASRTHARLVQSLPRTAGVLSSGVASEEFDAALALLGDHVNSGDVNMKLSAVLG